VRNGRTGGQRVRDGRIGRRRVRTRVEYRFCRVKDSVEPEALRAGGGESRQRGSKGLALLRSKKKEREKLRCRLLRRKKIFCYICQVNMGKIKKSFANHYYGGAIICQHQRERSRCKECAGVSICPHQRERSRCKECREEADASVVNTGPFIKNLLHNHFITEKI